MKKLMIILVLLILTDLGFCINAKAEEVHLSDIEDEYIVYCIEVGEMFDIEPSILLATGWQESNFNSEKVGGNVMQITNPKWFSEATDILGYTEVKENPYQNIVVCAFFLSKWTEYRDISFALESWNKGYENAKKLKQNTNYSKAIIERAEVFKKELERKEL